MKCLQYGQVKPSCISSRGWTGGVHLDGRIAGMVSRRPAGASRSQIGDEIPFLAVTFSLCEMKRH